MTSTEHANIYRLDGPRLVRWTFAYVSSNGTRQTSRKNYVTKWNAKRAARRLYPGLPLRVGRWGEDGPA